MAETRKWFGYLTIGVVAGVAGAAIAGFWSREYDAVRRDYVARSSEETRFVAEKLSDALKAVRDNLRTLSLLPGVRSVDRHGRNLSAEAEITIQQIYNNLSSDAKVSAVYILPIDFEPDRVDPVTGRREEPIAAFNQLILGVGEGVAEAGGAPDAASLLRSGGLLEPEIEGVPDQAGVPQIEIFAYREIKRQLAWLAEHYPTNQEITGVRVPMIGGKEVITSDNSVFDRSHDDADRMGIIHVAPFFGHDGKIKGGVAAITRTDVYREILAGDNYLLLNTRTGFRTLPREGGQAFASARFANAGVIDPNLNYSQVLPVETSDATGGWEIWAGRPKAEFDQSSEARGVRTAAIVSLGALLLLCVAAAALFRLASRNKRAAIEAVRSEQRQSTLARLDFLTELPNRLALNEILPAMLSENLAMGRGVGVATVDLDGFKHINDTLGHEAGDLALKAVSSRLKSALKHCIVARIGGDEFVILAPGADAMSMRGVAEAAVLALQTQLRLSDELTMPIGGSIGYAVAPQDGVAPDDLLRRSDLALIETKKNARGRAYRYVQALEEGGIRRRAVEAALRRALIEQRFEVAYQPILSRDGARLLGAEALARWADASLGVVQPSEFIPIAEAAGLMPVLGEQVLRKAISDAEAWGDVKICVNISAQQISHFTMASSVEALLAAHQFEPARLELELSESALIADESAARAQIARLQKLGVKIALDDFGAGYASLLHLRRFAFDKLKINRKFVSGCESAADARAIIIAVSALSHSLGLEITADGVENFAQHEFLSMAGIDRMQGFFFAKPVSAGEIAKLLRPARVGLAG